ncbi:MAG: TDT family transporter [Actinobacteria bacterium]|nr:TDT family transporter [Actinomycetota bacterium]
MACEAAAGVCTRNGGPVSGLQRVFASPIRGGDTVTIGPNWFGSVMGTGILANAAVTLPWVPQVSVIFARVVWTLSVAALAVLLVAYIVQLKRHGGVVREQLNHPVMSQFFGAPPMAMLTVSAGAVLVGIDFIGATAALWIAWVLFFVGTVLGFAVAVLVPFRLFTRIKVAQDAAFGGWLMPIVPPMLSAASGALLIPHTPAGELRLLLYYVGYSMFGFSLIASFIIITLIWHRLAHFGTIDTVRVPSLWIVLGPLGQSITAIGILGTSAVLVVSPAAAAWLNELVVAYGLPVFGFIVFWSALAILMTLRARRRGMPFALTWWSFTFPVGTCVTATSQLALHTGLVTLQITAVAAFIGLLIAWVFVAFQTTRGAYAGDLLRARLPDTPPATKE